jgi:hypothetical protein
MNDIRAIIRPLSCALGALCLLAACKGEATQDGPMTTTDPSNTDVQPIPAAPDVLKPVDPAQEWLNQHVEAVAEGRGVIAPPLTEQSRARRRMDIDQLDASIRQVTGGIGWVEVRGGKEINLFVELASTLGKPDFVESTVEVTEPSLIFQKFLGNAARSVCDKAIEADRGMSDERRNLLIHVSFEDVAPEADAAINENLSELLLRFHGREVAPDSAELNAWRWLFDSSMHVADNTGAAWRTVCVGLITHPDFYTY